jgi:hypothetical protein
MTWETLCGGVLHLLASRMLIKEITAKTLEEAHCHHQILSSRRTRRSYRRLTSQRDILSE